MDLFPRLKLWISTEETEGVFGDGKWRLLKSINQEGSLKGAAARLNISYRKAWGDLKKAEDCLGIKLITKTRGGADHGKTELTVEGRKLMLAYSQLHGEVRNNLENEFNVFLEQITYGK